MGRIRGFPRTNAVRELSTFRLDENSKRIRLRRPHEKVERKREIEGGRERGGFQGGDLFNPVESGVKRDERERKREKNYREIHGIPPGTRIATDVALLMRSAAYACGIN